MPPMSSPPLLLLLHLLPLLLATATTAKTGAAAAAAPATPPPPSATAPWPERYHAAVITNLTARGGGMQLIDLYYDWPRGRDLNVVRDQLAAGAPPRRSWSVEWANGTAFLFDAAGSCAVFRFAVGLLPPDWKSRAGAAYLGVARVDGFDCHVWSNFLFERYYEDVVTGRPVSWDFNGMQRHVLSFEAGAVMPDDSKWQAPAYCFTNTNGTGSSAGENVAASSS